VGPGRYPVAKGPAGLCAKNPGAGTFFNNQLSQTDKNAVHALNELDAAGSRSAPLQQT